LFLSTGEASIRNPNLKSETNSYQNGYWPRGSGGFALEKIMIDVN
jgi:hypothetical protein